MIYLNQRKVPSSKTSLLCVTKSSEGAFIEFLALLSSQLASLAQLAERALRKRTVVGSIPTGGFAWHRDLQ